MALAVTENVLFTLLITTEETEDNPDDRNDKNKHSIEKNKVTDDDVVDETDENTDDNSNDDDDTVDTSKYVNCVSIEDFEKVRKAIKSYRTDSVISDVKGLHVIKRYLKVFSTVGFLYAHPKSKCFQKIQ